MYGKNLYAPFNISSISDSISQNTNISSFNISKLQSFYISKAFHISNQYLKTLQYLKPISQNSISQLACLISQLASNSTISQNVHISTCLANISTCLKFANISKSQYLNLPSSYLKRNEDLYRNPSRLPRMISGTS